MLVKIMFRTLLLVVLCGIVSCSQNDRDTEKRPNILLILADDLGYGDLRSYNKNSLTKTPNLDRLAAEGLLLTNAYCPVSVCSPTRFALMTGTYPFRSWKNKGVMSNYEPSMIARGQLTLPQMLQESGYATAGFGKWHLGATFPTLDGKRPNGYGQFKAIDNGANIDLTKQISDGPVDHGFETWFGFSCASECWIMEGQNIVAALLHEFYNIESAQNKEHIQSIPPDQYLELITDKSIKFIHSQNENVEDNPFFLYYAPYVPHIPLSVSEKFKGTTEAGFYGDYIYELDMNIGKLLKSLEDTGQSENTIVVFASDNGSQFEMTSTDLDASKVSNSPKDVIKRQNLPNEHYPNGDLRGTKWSIWEGGVRTPLIAKWPGSIAAGSTSNQIFALTDIMATISALIGYELSENDAIDSQNQLPVLVGKDEIIRNSVVVQSSGNLFALRKGKWKYILRDGGESLGELYNLEADLSETENRIGENSELAEDLKMELLQIIRK